MNRRDFLFLRKANGDTAELSCEQLLMRCVDSTLDGTTAELFSSIERRLSSVKLLNVAEREWLGCNELKPLEAILNAFRQSGGYITYS